MAPAEFETKISAGERPQSHALDRLDTNIKELKVKKS